MDNIVLCGHRILWPALTTRSTHALGFSGTGTLWSVSFVFSLDATASDGLADACSAVEADLEASALVLVVWSPEV